MNFKRKPMEFDAHEIMIFHNIPLQKVGIYNTDITDI